MIVPTISWKHTKPSRPVPSTAPPKNITAQTLLSNREHGQILITQTKKTAKVSADRGAEEAVGEVELVVGVAGLRGDAQVEEADSSL